MSELIAALSAIERGRPQAAEQLLPFVYAELRALAAQRLASERPGQTLQATALVHEAFLRLIGPHSDSPRWNSRNHFMAAAAEAMRRILIESARRKQTAKRGGGWHAAPLDEIDVIEPAVAMSPADLLALNDALDCLAEEDPLKAELVKLRFFAGFSAEEAAEAIGVSRATAARYWDYAKSWLYAELRDGASSATDVPS